MMVIHSCTWIICAAESRRRRPINEINILTGGKEGARTKRLIKAANALKDIPSDRNIRTKNQSRLHELACGNLPPLTQSLDRYWRIGRVK